MSIILQTLSNHISRLSRVSLWLSLARIYAPQNKTRRLAFFLATTFGVLGTLCTISAVFGCHNSNWGTRLRVDQCFSNAHSFADAPLYAQLIVVCGLGKSSIIRGGIELSPFRSRHHLRHDPCLTPCLSSLQHATGTQEENCRHSSRLRKPHANYVCADFHHRCPWFQFTKVHV